MNEAIGRYEEATLRIQKIESPQERAFVTYGLMTVINGHATALGCVPSATFDLEYLCAVLQAMYANKQTLDNILDGRLAELSWFDDEPA